MERSIEREAVEEEKEQRQLNMGSVGQVITKPGQYGPHATYVLYKFPHGVFILLANYERIGLLLKIKKYFMKENY